MSNSAPNPLLSEEESEDFNRTVIERRSPKKFFLTLDPVNTGRPESLKEMRTRLATRIEEKKVIDKALNLRLGS